MRGRLTFIGYLGIVVGLSLIAVSVFAISLQQPDQGPRIVIMAFAGTGFALASYLWARR